ncbi:MAG: hypothetical protein ACJ8DC_11525 [Gemmatimonadales bacterium]
MEMIDRLGLFFGTESTRQGILARAALGSAGSDDDLVSRLVAALETEIRPDGTVGGAVVPTIWRVHELLDLGRGGQEPAVGRAVSWVLGLQGKPGAFGEGCDKPRHAQRICAHYVRGFFAPAPPEQRLAPITLPNGKVFRAEPAARFAISSLALRAALRTGHGAQPALQQHVTSLVGLAEQWTGWTGYFAPDVIIAGMHALALAGPELEPVVERLVELVSAHQAPDGTWPNADLFHVVEGLLATRHPAAKALIQRAAPSLASRQRADGTFGAPAQQERALIVLRAMLWSEGAP